MPEFGGIHHLNVSVTDLERSADWYTSVLGLQRGWENPDVEGRGRKLVLLRGAGHDLRHISVNTLRLRLL